MSSLVGPDEDDPRGKPAVPQEVQDAVSTLIRWAGDDPNREGLLETPRTRSAGLEGVLSGLRGRPGDPSRSYFRGGRGI